MSVNYVGGQKQFNHAEFDASGNPLASQSGRWTASNPVVASIDQTGLATWLGSGEVDILFVVGDFRHAGSIHEVVLAQEPAFLTMTPSTVTVYPGSLARVTVVATDINHNVLDPFTYDSIVSSDPSFDLIDIDGQSFMVLGITIGGGNATIIAGSVSQQVNVDVVASPAGMSQTDADARYRQLSVIIPDSQVSKVATVDHGTLVTGTPTITWAFNARAQSQKLSQNTVTTLTGIPVGEFLYVDLFTGAGGFTHHFTVSGLPALDWDNGNVEPDLTLSSNSRDSFMFYNEGARTVAARTYHNIPE